jgi:hypothetical protein
MMEISLEVSEHFYPLSHWKHEARLVLATTTTILFCCDDDTVLNPDERKSLELFSYKYWLGLPQESKLCVALAEVLKTFVEYFGSQDPLIGSLVAHSISSYIDSCVLETRWERGLPVHFDNHASSHSVPQGCVTEEFPAYFRSTSGLPVIYAAAIFKLSRYEEVASRFWISILPSLTIFINYGNDVLSLPKEILAGETWSFMSMKTKAKREAGRPTNFKSKHGKLWTFRDTFCETLEQVRAMTLKLDQAFTSCILSERHDCLADRNGQCAQCEKSQQDIKKAAQLWEVFKHGYIAFHINCDRYGLENLPSEKIPQPPVSDGYLKHYWGSILKAFNGGEKRSYN